MNTIKLEEILKMNKDEYLIVDMRDPQSVTYGLIDNALNMPGDSILENIDSIENDKKIIIYCAKGEMSSDLVSKVQNIGRDAYSLEGGYASWLRYKIMSPAEVEIDLCDEVEKSLRKKFHRRIFSKFAKAINEYQLLQEGDKVAVCISGGKDSMIMAKLFQELQRHRKFKFELVFLVMDPGYNELNRAVIVDNAEK